MTTNYLHLPLHRFKRVGEVLSHSCCKAAVNEVLEGSEAKRRLLPEFIHVHVNNVTANRKGESACQNTQLKEKMWVWKSVNNRKNDSHIHTSVSLLKISAFWYIYTPNTVREKPLYRALRPSVL